MKQSEPNFKEFHSRTASGWLPDKSMIKAWAILTAIEHDLEGIEESVLDDITLHINVSCILIIKHIA